MRVQKILILLSFLMLGSLPGISQYANNWIVPGQRYFKIPVAKTGTFRISFSTLQSAGFPVSTVDPRVVQMIHRGKEQAITIQGESDARFDAADYIEFYGKKNDGTLDSALYFPASLQPHPFYNLYSDTTAYFLTWNLSATRGKRMATFVQNNTTGIPKESFQIQSVLKLYTSEYCGGNTTGNGEIQNSYFDEGEGWTDSYICQGGSCTNFRDYTIDNITNGVAGAGTPALEVMLVGRDELNHNADIWVGPTAGSTRKVANVSFINFQTNKINVGLNWTDIGADGKMVVHVVANGVSGLRDRLSVSYINVTFPQGFDMSGQTSKTFTLAANAGGKSYVEFSSPGAGLKLWDVTDANTVSVIGTGITTGNLSAVVSGTTGVRTLYLSNEINAASLQEVIFQPIDPGLYNYIIVTHGSLLTGAQAYADYRASVAGGNYTPLTVTTDQLYNQFNYGETSPLAIYQLMKYLVEKGSPRFLFLIGKGLDVSQGFFRKSSVSATDMKDLVPSAGLPASDMLYSANLKGSGFVPTVATGRLSASSVLQVNAYLNKMKETESAPVNTPWRKQGLHLSGGILPQELLDFREYMDGFKSVAEGPYWGGQITTIAKHDPTAVKQINISDQVNSGVNLITFFGHSSPGTIDIDIGKVSDPKLGYNNPGKYPVFLINGCNAGNFFNNGTSFGEDWMLSSGKGARGFIAHSFFGYVQNLKIYTDLFYQVGFGDSTFIRQGIGEVLKEVASRYLQFYGPYMTNVTQVQQMLLLGDPALKLFGTLTPDYQTDDTSLSLVGFGSQPVTVASDSFAVRAIVRNLGAAKPSPVQIRIVRTYTDGFTEEILKVLPELFQQDTVDFIFKKGRTSGSGNTRFTVTLDYLNAVKEIDETNNTGTAAFMIPLGGTFNLFPQPYGIAAKAAIDFIFQSVNPLDAKRDFDWELDTVKTFTSGAKISRTVNGKVLLKTSQTVVGNDSAVFYWRTRLHAPGENESSLWTVSSFTLIRNSAEGWTQRQYDQLGENQLEGLVADPSAKKLNFVETRSDLLVTTYGWNHPASYLDVSVKINNTEFNIATEGDPCRNNTINFIAFNKTSLVPYPALDLGFQSINTCGREPQVINSFGYAEMDNGTDHDVLALIDHIHSGDSVLIFSVGNVNHQVWTPAIRAKMQLLGIDDAALSSLELGDPMVILARKDAAVGTAKVFLRSEANADELELQVAKTITGRYTSGKMNSVVIGPAAAWKRIIAKSGTSEPGDVYHFSLWGISLDGTETLIADDLARDTDISTLDASEFPQLRIKLETEDETNLTPVQLSQWLVLYTPVAEGVLLFDGPAAQQMLSEGQPWSGGYRFVTISPQAFTDSLTVKFDVVTAGVQKESRVFRIKPAAPGDTTSFTVTAPTAGKAGLNNVDVFVNPRILPEQFYQNNEIDLSAYLKVVHDDISPLLDVTFDGRRLINGDFVSPHPLIAIRLTDENKFLVKTDTSGILMVLTYPCATAECPGTPVYFNRNDIKFIPATASTPLLIEFTPQDLPDGDYSFFVQAADRSGNKSGPEPYEIQFRVSHETTFTFNSVYPNPSSGAFLFDFLLTGNEIPETFVLNLYASDGRLIQGFGINDVRGFHIGSNTLQWDPRDNSGGSLPSGMYIYRLALTVNGISVRETGKLILLK